MKAKNYPYVGDYNLDPPEDPPVCETCHGFGQVQDWTDSNGNWDVFDCPDCTPDPDPNDYPD